MNTSWEDAGARVEWKKVGLFLGLTFGFTYLLDLGVKLAGGLAKPYAIELLQLQMTLPAFFAIILGLFVFGDSPFRVGRSLPDGRRDRARGFFYLYIAFTLVLAALAVALLSTRGHERLLGAVSSAVIVAAVIGLLVFRVAKGRESFLRAGLRGGRFRHWLTYGGAVVLFLGIQAALNAAFGLGKAPDLTKVIPPGLHVPKPLFIAGVGVQSIVEGSLVGLVLGFGEEYGWRGFLQGQLIRLGRRRGVFLVGLIWGAWHWPIIWMGYNYPGYPVAGTAMMTLLTVLLAFVFGYAMLKTGSIWLVAFMHALFDQTGNYIAFAIDKPTSPIFSFGIGIYGLAMLAVVVLFLLRDPVWNEPVPAQAVIPPAAAPPA